MKALIAPRPAPRAQKARPAAGAELAPPLAAPLPPPQPQRPGDPGSHAPRERAGIGAAGGRGSAWRAPPRRRWTSCITETGEAHRRPSSEILASAHLHTFTATAGFARSRIHTSLSQLLKGSPDSNYIHSRHSQSAAHLLCNRCDVQSFCTHHSDPGGFPVAPQRQMGEPPRVWSLRNSIVATGRIQKGPQDHEAHV